MYARAIFAVDDRFVFVVYFACDLCKIIIMLYIARTRIICGIRHIIFIISFDTRSPQIFFSKNVSSLNYRILCLVAHSSSFLNHHNIIYYHHHHRYFFVNLTFLVVSYFFFTDLFTAERAIIILICTRVTHNYRDLRIQF